MVATYSGIRVDDDGTSTWPLTAAGAPTVFDEPVFATLTGASNTALVTYRNRLILLDPGGTLESFTQFFLPLNATIAFPLGTQIKFIQSTIGVAAISGVTGVTVTTSNSLQMKGIGARCIAQKIATNTWIVFGDLMPPTSGTTQWNDSISFQTAVNGGLLGSTTGFWTAVFGIINAQTLSLSRQIISKFNGAALGHALLANTTNATVMGTAGFTPSIAFINTPSYVPVANDIGKLIMFVTIYDQPAALMRLYTNAAQVGAGTTTAGQTYAPAPTERFGIGRRSGVGSSSCPDWTICGVAGGDAFVPTNAELINLFLRVRATGDIQPIPAKTTRLWSHRRQNISSNPVMWSDSQNLTAPSNIGIGTATWPPGGTTVGQAPADLTFVERVNPVYSWDSW